MMKYLSSTSYVQFICGLSFYGGWNRILTITWMSAQVMLIIGLFNYAVFNFIYLSKVLQDILILFGILSTVIKALLFHFKKDKYWQLYIEMEKTIEIKEKQNRFHFYVKAEKQFRILFKSYTLLLTIGVSLNACKPLAFIIYKHLSAGVIKPTDWTLPIPLSLYFNNSTSPGYEITYVIIVLGYIGCGMYFLVLDSLFLQMCLYIVAAFKDLQDMICNIDKIHVNDVYIESKKISSCSNDLIFLNNIKICFQFHNWLIRCENILQDVNSGIIFVSMLNSLIMITTSLFRILKLSTGELMYGIAALFVGYSGLIIYFFVGNLITTEGLIVSTTAYNGLWYKRCPNERRFYLAIILNGQKLRQFNGLHFFNCSMATFANVIKATFSFLTVMQNFS